VHVSKRILIVAHDPLLRSTRQSLLKSAGYEVVLAASDDLAIRAVDDERFDLVLIGRKSLLSDMALDQRLRERYPNLAVLKIADAGESFSSYPSRISDPSPYHVLRAIREMLIT
jgi:DNA-binding response OmpR family regulator